jgi:intracellular septation protein A
MPKALKYGIIISIFAVILFIAGIMAKSFLGDMYGRERQLMTDELSSNAGMPDTVNPFDDD